VDGGEKGGPGHQPLPRLQAHAGPRVQNYLNQPLF
jgi:hypothetical protein